MQAAARPQVQWPFVGAPVESLQKRYYFRAALDAARQLWGDPGVQDARARMPERERAEFFADPLPEWCPTRAMIAWNFALWEGPARRDKARYFPWVHRTTDLSFGRVKKLFLSMATPEKIITSAGELWRADQSSGALDGLVHGNCGTLVLRDHPYTETPQGRTAITEMLRYIVELSRARSPTATHALVSPGVLQMKIRWK
jgi:hypothetical protein